MGDRLLDKWRAIIEQLQGASNGEWWRTNLSYALRKKEPPTRGGSDLCRQAVCLVGVEEWQEVFFKVSHYNSYRNGEGGAGHLLVAGCCAKHDFTQIMLPDR